MFLKLLHRQVVFFLIVFFFLGCTQGGSKDTLFKQYHNIVKQYEKKIEKDPSNNEIKFKLSEFYYEFRDYSKAKEILKTINDIKAKILLAKVLAKSKEYTQALEVFEQIKINKKTSKQLTEDSEYFYLYGQVLENKNLYPKAIKIYTQVRGKFKLEALEKINDIKLKVENVFPESIANIAKEAVDFLKEVSDEAAIIYSVDEKTEIFGENSSVSTMHIIEQVLKERGKGLGEVEIGYDSTYEKVELEFARTISKDGKVIYAGKENIRDVSKHSNFPLYSNSRAFIVSMPLVEEGSFIEYKLKIYSSKLINGKDISFLYRLRERYPIFKAKFELIVPSDFNLNFKFFNMEYAGKHELKPVLKIGKGKKKYLWQLNRIKPLIPEYGMPPVAEINPAVLVSSFSSWDQIYEWWKGLFKDKLTLTQEMKEFVNSLTKEALDDFEKAKKIYEFCAASIRYVAVEYGESGHEPHYAKDVFLNRYGDCKDQAILLVAMLDEAGLSAQPVLIPTRRVYSISKEFPSTNFNHAIASVKIRDKIIFMDPTSETTSFTDLPLSDQDRDVLVFFNDRYEIMRTPEFKKNSVICKMQIVLDDQENAAIERSITTEGFFKSGHRWYLKYTHPSKIKEDIQKKMVEISPFSRLGDYKIENVDNFDKAPVLTYSFTSEKFLNPAGKLRIIPVINEINLDHNIIGKEERLFPVDLDSPHGSRAVISVAIPETLQIKYLPKSHAIDNEWFSFSYECDRLGNILLYKQDFYFKQRFIRKKDYKEFKKSLEKVLYFLREEAILEKIN